MSIAPQLHIPGGGGFKPVTTGVVAAIAVVSVIASLVPQIAVLLATPAHALGGDAAMALQLWRPFTAALLAPGWLSLLLAVIFTYWCGSSVEDVLGPRRYLLTVAATALGAAVFALLPAPGGGLTATAFTLAWGLIGASTTIAYQRGFDVRAQLVIVVIMLLMALQAGGLLIILGGLLGGVLAGCVIVYLPHRATRPDDWSRRHQTHSRRVDAALAGLVAALLVLWVVMVLLGL